MTSKNEILAYLAENKPVFQERFHLLKLGLFGSFAREEANESSDLDINIELEPGTQDIFEIKQIARVKENAPIAENEDKIIEAALMCPVSAIKIELLDQETK